MAHCFLIKICENCVVTVSSCAVIVMSRFSFLVLLSLLAYQVDSNVSVFIRQLSIFPSQFVLVCVFIGSRALQRSLLQFIDKLLLFTPLPSLVVWNVVVTLINELYFGIIKCRNLTLPACSSVKVIDNYCTSDINVKWLCD